MRGWLGAEDYRALLLMLLLLGETTAADRDGGCELRSGCYVWARLGGRSFGLGMMVFIFENNGFTEHFTVPIFQAIQFKEAYGANADHRLLNLLSNCQHLRSYK